jgi:hypothetical protein
MVAGVKCLCIGLWLAHGLDSDINPVATGQVTYGLHRLGVPRVDRVRGAELSGPLELPVIHVHGNNRVRSSQFRASDGRIAHATAADHGY